MAHLYLVLGLGQITAAQLEARHDDISGLFFLLAAGGWLLMPATKITESGVQLARFGKRWIAWSQVTAVLVPPSFDVNRFLKLQLVDGSVITLHNVAHTEASAVAALAQVPCHKQPDIRPPSPGVRVEKADDPSMPLSGPELTRRLQALTEQRQSLRAQLKSRDATIS